MELVDGLTHVREADGRRARHARSSGQLIFFKSVGQAAQVVFTLFTQTQPQINLYLGLHCPAGRPETFLTRDLWYERGKTARLQKLQN